MNKWKCKYCGSLNDGTNICDNCGANCDVKQNGKSDETTQKVKVVEKVVVKDVESQRKEHEKVEPKKSWFYRNMEWILPVPIMLVLLSPLWIQIIGGVITKGKVEQTFENAGYAVLEYGRIFRDDNISCLVEDSDGNEYTMYVSKSVVSDTGYKIVDRSHLKPTSVEINGERFFVVWNKLDGIDCGVLGLTEGNGMRMNSGEYYITVNQVDYKAIIESDGTGFLLPMDVYIS